MKAKIISISGMSCQHCVMALQKELLKLSLKINEIQVGKVKIEYDDTKVTNSQLENAVNEAGFSVITFTDA
jgi:copper chaperone